MAEDTSSARLSMPVDSNVHPQAPHITYGDLVEQFKLDVYGKEVQSAATYSYMWMADQMGHVCLGILINQVTTFGAQLLWQWFGWQRFAEIVSLVAAISIVAAWEASTFFSSEESATGLFPLGRKLLRNNAIIATAYMALGAVIGFGFHIGIPWSDIVVIGACTFIAIWLAPRWLRQKIIWQKAALPYLSRLAAMERTIGEEAAKALQALLDAGAPPNVKPAQVIIGGPLGSGRTQLAAGIGTEYAFKKVKARYLSVQSLLEFAAAAQPPDFPDDPGPVNLNYWRWSEAQVVIIDDLGPLIAPRFDQHEAILDHFRGILDKELKPVAEILTRCHTVWVIGDLRPPGNTLLVGDILDQFAVAVSDYVKGQQAPLVIELKAISPPDAAEGSKVKAAARYVATDRSGGDEMAGFSKALGSRASG